MIENHVHSVLTLESCPWAGIATGRVARNYCRELPLSWTSLIAACRWLKTAIDRATSRSIDGSIRLVCRTTRCGFWVAEANLLGAGLAYGWRWLPWLGVWMTPVEDCFWEKLLATCAQVDCASKVLRTNSFCKAVSPKAPPTHSMLTALFALQKYQPISNWSHTRHLLRRTPAYRWQHYAPSPLAPAHHYSIVALRDAAPTWLYVRRTAR